MRCTARVTDIAGRRLGLEISAPVCPGRAIRIECGDAVFLGEAVWCHRQPDAHLVSVELDQVLSGLAALGENVRQFAAEPLGPETVKALKDRNQQNGKQTDEKQDRGALSDVPPHQLGLKKPVHWTHSHS